MEQRDVVEDAASGRCEERLLCVLLAERLLRLAVGKTVIGWQLPLYSIVYLVGVSIETMRECQ